MGNVRASSSYSSEELNSLGSYSSDDEQSSRDVQEARYDSCREKLSKSESNKTFFEKIEILKVNPDQKAEAKRLLKKRESAWSAKTSDIDSGCLKLLYFPIFILFFRWVPGIFEAKKLNEKRDLLVNPTSKLTQSFEILNQLETTINRDCGLNLDLTEKEDFKTFKEIIEGNSHHSQTDLNSTLRRFKHLAGTKAETITIQKLAKGARKIVLNWGKEIEKVKRSEKVSSAVLKAIVAQAEKKLKKTDGYQTKYMVAYGNRLWAKDSVDIRAQELADYFNADMTVDVDGKNPLEALEQKITAHAGEMASAKGEADNPGKIREYKKQIKQKLLTNPTFIKSFQTAQEMLVNGISDLRNPRLVANEFLTSLHSTLKDIAKLNDTSTYMIEKNYAKNRSFLDDQTIYDKPIYGKKFSPEVEKLNNDLKSLEQKLKTNKQAREAMGQRLATFWSGLKEVITAAETEAQNKKKLLDQLEAFSENTGDLWSGLKVEKPINLDHKNLAEKLGEPLLKILKDLAGTSGYGSPTLFKMFYEAVFRGGVKLEDLLNSDEVKIDDLVETIEGYEDVYRFKKTPTPTSAASSSSTPIDTIGITALRQKMGNRLAALTVEESLNAENLFNTNTAGQGNLSVGDPAKKTSSIWSRMKELWGTSQTKEEALLLSADYGSFDSADVLLGPNSNEVIEI